MKKYGSTSDPEENSVNAAKPVAATTWGQMFVAWPKITFCIVGNEFCERFSYYGMRTVLTLYLLNILKFSDGVSTVFFNGFTVLCYLTPLLGSIIADGYIGKFKTIFFVSILYAAGQIVLAISSINAPGTSVHPYLDLAGLLIIAFGTGGIKPCVASFGGDQFPAHEERMLSLFFSVFYFSINAGSMISTFISPIFRSQACLGQDSCYPMAFGIPAILMIVATAVFMLGSFWYKKPPPKENIFGEVFRLIVRAIRNKGRDEPREHWLQHYLYDHECSNDPKCLELQQTKRNPNVCQKRQFVDDVRSLFRVIIMFLPVPVFWALYDQQGSVWLIQGIQMDCKLWGDTLLLPDQMQTLNAVLILLFIPLFQVIIYPVLSKCFTLTPLRKMVGGGLLAALAFVVSGLVQLKINQTLFDNPPVGQTYVAVTNTLPFCNLNIKTNHDDTWKHLEPLQSLQYTHDDFSLFKVPSGDTTFSFTSNCTGTNLPVTSYTTSFDDKNVYSVVVTKLGAFTAKLDTDKPTQGTGEFSISINLALNDVNYLSHLALCRVGGDGTSAEYPCNPQAASDFYYYEVNYNDGRDDDVDSFTKYTINDNAVSGTEQFATVYTFKPVKPGSWGIFYMQNMAKTIGRQTLSKEEVSVVPTNLTIEIKNQGGVYAAILTGNYASPEMTINHIVPDNVLSILWQVPQFVIITAAEILFSITGYEFAYSQAAPSMKALVQALWLLTTAIGDAIIVAIAAAKLFSNMATQAFVYAAFMTVVIGIFALMAIFYYEYKYYTGSGDEEEEELLEKRTMSLTQPKDGIPTRRHSTLVHRKPSDSEGYNNATFTERF